MFGLKVVRREAPSKLVSLGVSLSSLALGFMVTAFLLAAIGSDPVTAYAQIAGILANPREVGESVTRGIPIMLVAVGLAMAFRMNFWNIGGEGQIYMGAFGATLVGVFWSALIPDWVLLATMFLASFVAGGMWALLPALLRAKLEVNEVLTTLMMNFIANALGLYLVYGSWRDPSARGFPWSPPLPPAGLLPAVPGTRVHLGLAFGLVAAVLAYYLIRKTKLGFEIRVIGDSPAAAKYAGISYLRTVSMVLLIGGGMSGLAGLSIVGGMVGRLSRPADLSPGYGYSAIIVAWLAALNPLLIAPVSILFGGLLVAGDVLQASMNLPFATVQVIQAVILVFLIAGEVLKRYRLTRVRRQEHG